VAATQDDVDGVLFTGVVPYVRATVEGVLRRPAEHVSYDGATLLRALVEQLRLGHDMTAVSIDTLTKAQVVETMTEARLPTDGVHVLEYRIGLSSDEIVAFHRTAHDVWDAKVAITCLGSAYHQLSSEMYVVRLAPSRHSILSALRNLELTVSGMHTGDARVAIGLVDLGGDTDQQLSREVATLGGMLARVEDGYLIVSTLGALEMLTNHFEHWPLLQQLRERHERVHIGFGIGRTAADAESQARLALGRSKAAGNAAAAVTLGDGGDVIVRTADETADTPRTVGAESLTVLGRRAGMSRDTLVRLRELVTHESNARGVSSSTVAECLGVEQRTARKLLKRLERAGVAEALAPQRDGSNGRPLTFYRVHL
jgi:DNA-binding transcriptional ArsR family regulator